MSEYEATEECSICHGSGFTTPGEAQSYGLIQQWIPTQEQMPKHWHSVLIHDPQNGVTAGYLNGRDEFLAHKGWVYPNVTHWMPLPEPPA